MKHYVTLFVEAPFLRDNYYLQQYFKEAVLPNDIPPLPDYDVSIGNNFPEAIKAFEKNGFKKIESLTLAELFLLNVAEWTILVFDSEYKFQKLSKFKRLC